MSSDRLREVWAAGGVAIGTYLMYSRDLATVEIAAAAGLDFLLFDLEHRPHGAETIHDLCQAARLAGIAPLVGPAQIDHHDIAHVLDLGASGVVVPHVETSADVQQAIGAARYPPLGERGRAGVAGHNLYRPTGSSAEVLDEQNRGIVVLLKLESESAIDRVDELTAIEGVDGAMVGPLDLSIGLGIAGQTQHPRVLDLVDRVRDACRQRGRHFGTHVDAPEHVREAIEAGATWIIVGSELDFLSDAWTRAARAAQG